MAENSVSNPRSKLAPVWGGSMAWFYLTKRVGGRVRFIWSRIGDSLARAKMVWVVYVILETTSRSISKLDAGKSKRLCFHQKYSVTTVQLIILSLVWPTVRMIEIAHFSVHILLLHHYESNLAHISDFDSLVIGLSKSERWAKNNKNEWLVVYVQNLHTFE